jgi:hypothetical protein
MLCELGVSLDNLGPIRTIYTIIVTSIDGWWWCDVVVIGGIGARRRIVGPISTKLHATRSNINTPFFTLGCLHHYKTKEWSYDDYGIYWKK